MEFVKSSRGGELLCLNGFVLSINYRRNNKKYWKCRKANCKFTAVTEEQELLSSRGEHGHPPEQAKIEIKKAVERAKAICKNEPHKPLKRAYREAFEEVDMENEQNLDDLPSLQKYKPTLYRARRKRLPKLPHTLAEITLPEEWRTTEDGRNFLLANDGVEERILIFGTSQNIRYLCAADTIFMDGTFKISPDMFHQVYALHAVVMGVMVPLCICLLPSKTGATYKRMFSLIKNVSVQLGHQFNPGTFCIDYESAVITAIDELFPNSRVRGCLFHYSQALWRYVQTCGLVQRYRNDDNFNRLVRRAFALPLVPPASIDDVWLRAMDEEPDPEVERFKDYVTTTWVDNLTARFPYEIWNQYDNIGGIRTTNNLESWHSKMKKELERPHPNVFRFIELLKEEQTRVENELRLLQAGGQVPAQRQKYRNVTLRLLRLKVRLESNQIDVYHYAGAVGGILTPNE